MPSSNADLASLTVSAEVLNPAFDPDTTSYSAIIIGETSVTVTPTAAAAGAVITINGAPVASGQASEAIELNPGLNGTTITIKVTAADGVTSRTYALTASRLSQETYIKASNTGVPDQFGISVALSGDTLAVGAWAESSSAVGINGDQNNEAASFSGAVYVFTREGTAWTQQAYIKVRHPTPKQPTSSAPAWLFRAIPWPWGRRVNPAMPWE